jgi:hypothetical protein
VAAKDGHILTAKELTTLDDPIANFVLKGAGCPVTLSEIQEKLAKIDPCGKDDRGVSTRLVSDRSQLLELPDGNAGQCLWRRRPLTSTRGCIPKRFLSRRVP